jgi:hypothetical protein
MEDGIFSWSNFHGLISYKNQFIKSLGPSLGVNQMWTKRSDHTPRSECVNLKNKCPKKAFLKKEIQV